MSDISFFSEREWGFIRKRFELTPRESQIASLILQALEGPLIARRLRIRPGTVKTHTRNIYRKVRVRNKINLFLRFLIVARELKTEEKVTP